MIDIRNFNKLSSTSRNSKGTYYLFGNPTYYGSAQLAKRNSSVKKRDNDQLFKTVSRSFNVGSRIEPLEQTAVEINNIEKILTTDSMDYLSFTETAANEPNLKKMNSPKVIHIATHGFFAEDLPAGN